jgi:hypothetical protein
MGEDILFLKEYSLKNLILFKYESHNVKDGTMQIISILTISFDPLYSVLAKSALWERRSQSGAPKMGVRGEFHSQLFLGARARALLAFW